MRVSPYPRVSKKHRPLVTRVTSGVVAGPNGWTTPWMTLAPIKLPKKVQAVFDVSVTLDMGAGPGRLLIHTDQGIFEIRGARVVRAKP